MDWQADSRGSAEVVLEVVLQVKPNPALRGAKTAAVPAAFVPATGAHTYLFAISVLLSAFLLFSIQPMVAKFLLPAFGGSAGVWATCLAVFQLLLLGGYAYAHALSTRLTPAQQRLVHLCLLAVCFLFLPIVPRAEAGDQAVNMPILQLVWVLTRCLGLPFLALSATAPLLMEWFRRSYPERSPDRLYAFSNAGSLLALLAYPLVLERMLTRLGQAMFWAGGVLLFFLLCLGTAWISRKPADAKPKPAQNMAKHMVVSDDIRVSAPAWLWVVLPACGSGLLLALTNQICQDVTPVPLLWVMPMGIYLLSFILCFEGPRSYRRGFFLPMCMVGLLALSWMLYYGGMYGFGFQLVTYLGILFFGCMVCHGELYRIRPLPEKLTVYYLCISIGGALGGSFVALVAPHLFNNVMETPILALALAVLIAVLAWREGSLIRIGRRQLAAGPVAVAGAVAVLMMLGWVTYLRQQQSLDWARNFYGVYQVKQGPTWLINNVPFPLTNGPGRLLVSGQVYHGLQFLDPASANQPTAYFSTESGLGLAFRELPTQTNRSIGVIGLGVGTVAAYGRPGDRIRFYELNPAVLEFAQRYFTFLSNSPAKVEVVLGDGRLSLEREASEQQFDLFVLDAFNGDSIPTHLLTEEAMRVYLRHLSPKGVMAFHISNNHLDLEPVVLALAANHGLNAVLVPPTTFDPGSGKLSSLWMLLSSSDAFCSRPAIADLMSGYARTQPSRRLLWTDDHFSILPILR